KVSQTAVSVVYISEIADEKLVKDVLDRIGKIDIDNVSDSSYIAKLICSREASVFKQLNTAEKPDVVVARIMEGRVAIIVDGSPIVLTLPYLLVEDFQNPEDYYMTTARALFTRWIRFAAVCIAVLLPAFYVASELFHLQFLPLNFLLTIINSIKGIPMAPSFEMFFVLVIFEVLNEASTRMPKYAGMALSVVGALVLGETAVQAGIVSTPAILIMSISAISLYTVPELVETMSLIRLIMLIVAGCAGGYGIIIATVFITAYLCSLENFGVSILAPYAPTVPADMKDSLYIAPLSEMDTRPLSIGQKNKRRFRLAKDGGKK
ncbi:MAG: spore germination protein, partial [Clostridia bacterium]|nr:spore germination protein [Clostridia bacterium]